MRLTTFTLLVLCLVAVCKSAEEEYDYEEEAPATPSTPAPAKPARLGGLLSSRGRVNVGGARKGPAAAPSTTSKPVEPAVDEGEENEEAIDEGVEQEEVQTTTTESAKKIRGGVRPFRSNEDLLAALKRRRAQTGSTSHTKEASATHQAAESTTSKSKASTSHRNKGTSNSADARAPSRARFGSSRGGKPVQEEVEETQREEVQVKPKTYRRG